MKTPLFLIALLFFYKAFSQSPEEAKVLRLSSSMFTWEVNGNMDSLAHFFDEKLSIVNSRAGYKIRNNT